MATTHCVGALAPRATLPQGLTLLRDDNDQVCSSAQRVRLYWENSENLPRASSRGNSFPCLNECISTSSAPMCTMSTLDSKNLSISTTSTIACYCSQRLLSEVASKGIITGTNTLLNVDGQLCSKV